MSAASDAPILTKTTNSEVAGSMDAQETTGTKRSEISLCEGESGSDDQKEGAVSYHKVQKARKRDDVTRHDPHRVGQGGMRRRRRRYLVVPSPPVASQQETGGKAPSDNDTAMEEGRDKDLPST